MVDEIKKEIEINTIIVDDYYDYETEVIDKEVLFEILDKYKNQEKPTIFIDTEDMEERYGTQLYIEYLERYKKCWEELKERMNDDRFCPCFMDMQELEHKIGIGERE